MNYPLKEELKTRKIKTTGIIIMVIAGLMAMGALSGGAMSIILDFDEMFRNINTGNDSSGFAILIFFKYYTYFAAAYLIISILFFIGGMSLKNYKKSGAKLLTALSSILVFILLSFAIYLIIDLLMADKIMFFTLVGAMMPLFFSAPFAFLIWFIGRKDFKEHLE